jgi:hypothetical protein
MDHYFYNWSDQPSKITKECHNNIIEFHVCYKATYEGKTKKVKDQESEIIIRQGIFFFFFWTMECIIRKKNKKTSSVANGRKTFFFFLKNSELMCNVRNCRTVITINSGSVVSNVPDLVNWKIPIIALVLVIIFYIIIVIMIMTWCTILTFTVRRTQTTTHDSIAVTTCPVSHSLSSS